MANNGIVKEGPWGGNGGDPWEIIADGTFTGIKIRSGVVIDAICFIFKDGSGNTYESAKFGGDNGTLHEIIFANDEEIIKINGTYGEYEDLTVVTSLTFHTNKNTYGIYGTRTGLDFSMPVTEGKIIGFFGRSGDLLDAIGIILGT